MDLFQILGKIAIQNSDANKSIDDTGDRAKDASEDVKKFGDEGGKSESKLKTAFEKIGSAAVKVGKVVGTGISAGSVALAKLAKDSIESYAEYEQLVGGVETLFKDNADTVVQYSQQAYRTAGMSANEYMNTVTGFSASLLQSLGGDTKKAAEYANTAVIDMSDNANKMGTSMEAIQNAYAGFSKQNYTMLDNLKLGYGGTKEEMERLLADAEKLTGKKFDISNFADITEAIHAIQVNMDISGYSADELKNKLKNMSLSGDEIKKVAKDMGISYDEAMKRMKDGTLTVQDAQVLLGTTAREASSTIQGSIGSMKSAWENLMTGLSDPNQDLGQLISNFIDTGVTAINNIVPRIKELFPRIKQAIEQIAEKVVPLISDLVTDLAPTLISGAVSLIDSLVSQLPSLISTLLPALIDGSVTLINSLVAELPTILEALTSPEVLGSVINGIIELFNSLIENLPTILTVLTEALPSAIETIVTALTDQENLHALIEGTIQLALGIVDSADQIISTIVPMLPTIIVDVASAIVKEIPTILRGVGEMVTSLVKFIADWYASWIEGFSAAFKKIITHIGEFFTDMKANIKENLEQAKQNIHQKWEEIKSGIKEKIESIKSNVTESFESIKSAISEKIEAAKTAVHEKFEAIKTGISEKIESTKENIHEKFEAIKTGISNAVTTVKETISNIFGTIKDIMTKPFTAAWDLISPVIDKLKSAFNFKWSLPHLNLPHISVSGGTAPYGIGGKGKLPSFSIEWYKKAMDQGMIMNKPTIFGYNPQTGKVMGGGEAGSETIVGTDSLMMMITKAVASVIQSLNIELYLDGDKLVGGTVKRMNKKLGEIQAITSRGGTV